LGIACSPSGNSYRVVGGVCRQDAIVQSQIASLNASFEGKITVGNVHLAPFENFPYVSLKVDDVTVHESKKAEATVLLDVADIYVGFNLWDLARGNYDIQSITVEDGFFDLIVHTDGKTNLENALTSSDMSDGGEPLNVHLHKIELKNIDIHQRQEATNKEIETLIYWAKGGLSSAKMETNCSTTLIVSLSSTLLMRVIRPI